MSLKYKSIKRPFKQRFVPTASNACIRNMFKVGQFHIGKACVHTQRPPPQPKGVGEALKANPDQTRSRGEESVTCSCPIRPLIRGTGYASTV